MPFLNILPYVQYLFFRHKEMYINLLRLTGLFNGGNVNIDWNGKGHTFERIFRDVLVILAISGLLAFTTIVQNRTIWLLY